MESQKPKAQSPRSKVWIFDTRPSACDLPIRPGSSKKVRRKTGAVATKPPPQSPYEDIIAHRSKFPRRHRPRSRAPHRRLRDDLRLDRRDHESSAARGVRELPAFRGLPDRNGSALRGPRGQRQGPREDPGKPRHSARPDAQRMECQSDRRGRTHPAHRAADQGHQVHQRHRPRLGWRARRQLGGRPVGALHRRGDRRRDRRTRVLPARRRDGRRVVLRSDRQQHAHPHHGIDRELYREQLQLRRRRPHRSAGAEKVGAGEKTGAGLHPRAMPRRASRRRLPVPPPPRAARARAGG